MFAWVLFTGDHFDVNIGDTKKVIIRQDAPLVYRGAEIVSVLAGIMCFATGIYFLRRKQ